MSPSSNTPTLVLSEDAPQDAEEVVLPRRGFWDLLAAAMEFSGRMQETSNPYQQRALAEAWLRTLDGPVAHPEAAANSRTPVRMPASSTAPSRRQDAETLAA